MENCDMERYSVITEKNKREIVLLRGSGCKWRKCRFCDYHLDFSKNQDDNFELNKNVLGNVSGIYGKLEVINSGSFSDLDKNTLELIKKICIEKNIHTLHCEMHWLHKDEILPLKKQFREKNIDIRVKSGIETFDYLFRESYLEKGIPNVSPEALAKYFDEVCLLFGIPGQSEKLMRADIETGLLYFKRVCVNIMQKNNSHIMPDKRVIKTFVEKIYPVYKDNERVDILLNNTDFGVGGEM